MALQDLVMNNKQISADLVENLLKGRVELIQEGKKVILTKDGMRLPNRSKILLFLVGGKAWELLDGDGWSSSPSVMEEVLGIPGNTLRPILKSFTDSFLVKSEKGKYQILSKGIYEFETILDEGENRGIDISGSDSGIGKSAPIKKIVGGPSKSKAIEELMSEGYFSDLRDLAKFKLNWDDVGYLSS